MIRKELCLSAKTKHWTENEKKMRKVHRPPVFRCAAEQLSDKTEQFFPSVANVFRDSLYHKEEF